MTLSALQVLRFDRPLRRPIATARGRIVVRSSLRVRIEDDAGHVGHGEAAPLPGFAAGDLARASRVLAAAGEALPGLTLDAARAWAASVPDDPCAAWALDAALVDLGAQQAGRSMAAWLAAPGRSAEAVPLTAFLSSQEPVDLEAEAGRAAARGECALKLKVGGGSLQRDVERVAAARSGAGHQIRLRLDANGAWDVDEARRRLDALARFDLEWVEQPVGARDLAGLRRLRRDTGVSIAVDESIRSADDAERVVALEAADVLALKPAALGAIGVTQRIVELARERDLEVVLGSLFDGACSLWAGVHLAAALRCTRACGFGTGALVDEGSCSPRAERGWVRLPPESVPGLGLEIGEGRVPAS